MPAFTSITLNDAQATPVAHVFYPVTKFSTEQEVVASYEDKSGGQAIAFKVLRLRYRRPINPIGSGGKARTSTDDRVYRLVMEVSDPVLETLGTASNGIMPAQTISYVTRAKVELMIPERATLQNRKDLFAYVRNALVATGAFETMAHNLEAITG
jgi:hypothetical protein